MAKLRFKGDQRASVPLLGRDVDPDEVVDVPDDLIASPLYEMREGDDGKNHRVQVGWMGYEWPEELWSEVATPKPAKAKDEE